MSEQPADAAPSGPKKTSSLAKSSAIMASGTLVSRVLGMVKSVLLVAAIGLTIDAANAFDVANKVPNTLYMLIGGGILNAVLVPQIVRATKRPDGGRDFINRLLTLAITVLTVLTAAATLCAPLLIRLYSSGWSGEQTALATAFAYWCLPQVLFYGLYTLLGQVLNAKESFGPYMWAPVLNNVVSIVGLVAFIVLFGPGGAGQHAVGTWDAAQITLLAGSTTLGVVAQALILLIPLRRIGFRFRPAFGFRGVGLGTAGRVAGWTFSAMMVGQLGFLIISRVASTASGTAAESSASTAAYTNAYLIFMLPHSLVAVSLVTALFTTLSKSASDGDSGAVAASFAQGTRLVGLVNMFFTAALVALGIPTAMALYGNSAAQAHALGQVIVTMVLGLVPFSANYLAQRVFYAYEDARTPFWIQVIQIAVQTLGVLASGVLLHKNLIVAGIGLSMSFGYVVACVLSIALLRRRLGRLGLGSILLAHVKFAVAGAVSALVGWLLYRMIGEERVLTGRLPSLLTVAIVGVVMLAVYLILCITLRVGELRSLLAVLRRKLGRGRAAQPATARRAGFDDDPAQRVREGFDVATQAFDVVGDQPAQPSQPVPEEPNEPGGPDDTGTPPPDAGGPRLPRRPKH